MRWHDGKRFRACELVQHAQAVVSPTVLEGGPFQVFENGINLNRAPVLTRHKAGASALDLLDLVTETRFVLPVGVGVLREVPDTAGILHLGSNEGFVGQFPRGLLSDSYVPFEHPQGTAGFGRVRLNLLVPLEVSLDCDT